MDDRRLTKLIGVDDVVDALRCSKSLAYRHLRAAARRPAGSRGLLRVPLATWESYVEANWGHNASTLAATPAARRPPMPRPRHALREQPAPLDIPVTQPRKPRPHQ